MDTNLTTAPNIKTSMSPPNGAIALKSCDLVSHVVNALLMVMLSVQRTITYQDGAPIE